MTEYFERVEVTTENGTRTFEDVTVNFSGMQLTVYDKASRLLFATTFHYEIKPA